VPIEEGQSFGNYNILARIGAGGMGKVYLAEHPLIGRKVALKVIHKDLAGNREIVTRFFNEARLVNQIGNEHIVEVHDLGQSPEGEYFFIMEYLDGHTLADVLERQGVLAVNRALHIAAQVASALGAAHERGIIHRDLKPDNVMLVTRHGDPDFVKVLDFGLAKMFLDAGVQLTAQGVVLGTPQYMSPEACESKQGIDHRADIYSLGVLLFQMLTGQLPFDGRSMGEVLVKQVTQLPPAPRALNPYIPPAVEQILLRCLAKQSGDRFGTMAELGAALRDPDRYLASSPPVLPSAPVSVDAQERAVVAKLGLGAVPGDAPVASVVAPQNRTMRIDTPRGYRRKPRWPLIVALASVVAVSAVVTAIVLAGGEPANPHASPGEAISHEAADGPAREAADEPARAAGDESAGVRVDAPAQGTEPDAHERVVAVLETVTVDVATEPAGARIYDASGALLGTTPAAIALPRDGAEHVLTFRHPRARERQKSVIASGDSEIQIQLELIEPAAPRRAPRGKGGR
jgi:eukaryotic-like serine/threonine-protein kinase